MNFQKYKDIRIKITKFVSILIVSMASVLSFTSCGEKEDLIGNKFVKVYLSIDGLDCTREGESLDSPYIAQSPAEGLTFTVEGVLDENVPFITLDKIFVNQEEQSEGPDFSTPAPWLESNPLLSGDWGKVIPIKIINPSSTHDLYKYKIILSPNDTGTVREYRFVFGYVYNSVPVIITQASL